MKLYFERHDGQAVTCDDFAQAIADANPASELARLLPQFKHWYSQAGTPQLQASGHYDGAAQTYTLTLSQSCAATPGQSDKQPFVIPVGLGLLGPDGQDLPLDLGDGSAPSSRTLVLSEPSQSFVFRGVASEPVPSILRGFSAPVKLQAPLSDAQLLHLLAHDSDPFNRWEAGQRLGIGLALQALAHNDSDELLGDDYVQAMRSVLRHPTLDAAFKELVLTLPSEVYLAEQVEAVDPQRIHAVRQSMRLQLAMALRDDWQALWHELQDSASYRPDAYSSGRRALAGMALAHLCLADVAEREDRWPQVALERFGQASNMTDRFNALGALVGSGHRLAATALEQFHALFKQEPLVIDKWFSLQAGAPDHGGHILPIVRQLLKHPDFNLRNPNRARSLITTFCQGNPGGFHRADAAGFVFWGERVLELDAFNPQVAARLARALDRWKKLVEPYRSAAREAIARVAARSDLSKDVREVVTRALAD
jgi:aminopeptidase N